MQSLLDLLQYLLDGRFLALLGASFAVIFAGIGSAKAVGMVGEVVAGVVTEEPDKFGKAILLQALPGTQGIYGLIIAFLILFRIGLITGDLKELTTVQGLLFFAASLPIAIVGYKSAIAQGKTAAAGVGIVAKRPNEQAKAVTMAAMVETYAVLALLASVIMVFRISV